MLSVLQVGVECVLKCEWKFLSGKEGGSNVPWSMYTQLPPPPTLLGGVPLLPFPSVTPAFQTLPNWQVFPDYLQSRPHLPSVSAWEVWV